MNTTMNTTMKHLLALATFAAISHLAPAQGLTDQLEGWRHKFHGDKAESTFSELRFDTTDKVAGIGCLAYDIKGRPGPDLWAALICDKLPETVDLTSQQAVAFSYKINVRELTDLNGQPRNTLNMWIYLGNPKLNSTIIFVGTYFADEEWHEVVVPVENFIVDVNDSGVSKDWDRTDVTSLSISQILQGMEILDITVKIADLRFIPVAPAP